VSTLARAAQQTSPTVALAALVLVSLAGFLAAFDGAFLQADSAQYVSMAKNLMAGHGAATSLAWSEEHLRLGRIPVAQTNLPPGYPLLIALVSHVGVAPLWSALLVAAVCFGIVPLLLYWLLRQAATPRVPAFVVSAAWFVLPVVWANVLACLSEMTYVALSLACVACLRRSELSARHANAWLLLAGLAAGAAFVVRYAALVLVLSLGAYFLLRAVLRRDMWSLRALVLVPAPAMAVGVVLLARNYGLTGTLIGGLRRDDSNSLLAVLRTVWWSLGEMSGFTRSGLRRGDVEEWLLLVLAAAGLVWLATGARVRIDGAAVRAMLSHVHAAFAVIYVPGSVAFLIVVTTTHASGAVTARYLIPLIPFVLLLVPGALGAVRWQLPGPRHRAVATTLAAGAIVAFLAGQADVAESHWNHVQHGRYRQVQRAFAESFGHGTLRDFLSQRVPPETPLLANEPQLSGIVLDRPMVGLPGASYSHRVFTAEEAHRILCRYGVAYVVVFPRLPDDYELDDANQAFFSDLKSGKVPGWLAPTFSSSRIQLYQVAKPMTGGGV